MRVPRLIPLVVVAAVVVACATTGTSSMGGGAAMSARPDSSLLRPDSLAIGQRIYVTSVCGQCHGATGGGGMGGPNLTDQEWLQTNGSYRGIVAIITGGVALADVRETSFRRPMPPRGGPSNLTDEQVRVLAAYVWSLSNPQQQ